MHGSMKINFQKNPNIKIIISIISIYIINRFILKNSFPDNIFINGYLNDLIVMPLIFRTFYLSSKILNIKRFPDDKLLYYFMTFLLCSFCFEFIRPVFVKNSTLDYLDIFCYGLGTSFDYLLKRKFKY